VQERQEGRARERAREQEQALGQVWRRCHARRILVGRLPRRRQLNNPSRSLSLDAPRFRRPQTAAAAAAAGTEGGET
jgi:hypothetical protein